MVQEDKELYRLHISGKPTKESILLMDKLIVDAKIRLKKSHLKLPDFHFGALRGIFKDQIKQHILNKQTSLEQAKIKMSEMIDQEKGQFREITDPDEINKYLNGEMGQGIPRFNMTMDP